MPQPFTLTATTTCTSGSGTLDVSTCAIGVTRSAGTQATIDPLTITASAACAQSARLAATTSPLAATVSDGTSVSVSQVSADASSPASTTVGATLGQLRDLVCRLADLLAGYGSPLDAVGLLSRVLAEVTGVSSVDPPV